MPKNGQCHAESIIVAISIHHKYVNAMVTVMMLQVSYNYTVHIVNNYNK